MLHPLQEATVRVAIVCERQAPCHAVHTVKKGITETEQTLAVFHVFMNLLPTICSSPLQESRLLLVKALPVAKNMSGVPVQLPVVVA